MFSGWDSSACMEGPSGEGARAGEKTTQLPEDNKRLTFPPAFEFAPNKQQACEQEARLRVQAGQRRLTAGVP